MSESSRSIRARQILAEADQIVAQDRKLTLQLLRALHEIELNKFYLELGYGSMFDYCTRHLKFSEWSAVRRIRTARCMAKYPCLAELLDSGEVNPSTVAAVYKHLRPENADAMIEGIRGKSSREVDRFVAALQPLSIVPPDRVRSFVVQAPGCGNFTSNVAGNEPGPSAAPVSVPASVRSQGTTPRQDLELKRMLRVELSMPEERMQKLERIRALASHRLAQGASLSDLIDFMADYILRREDPAERVKHREARAAKQGESVKAPAGSPSSRRIAAAVKDKVFIRDEQQCSYVGPDGTRCSSTHVLQVDHIEPVARGGAGTIDNLRLLCAYHNRLESERLMGKRQGSRSGH